jgi:nucleotide-binding universal stress UspA family protein
MARSSSPFGSILVPVDGSPLAEQSLPMALDIAERAQSKVKLVLVHQTPPVFLAPEDAKLYSRVDLAVLKAERDYLRGLVQRLRPRIGKKLTSAVLQGPPALTLSKYIPQADADLVVLTTHGRGGLRRAWLGSVADHLVRTLEIPLLLIRAQEVAPDLTRLDSIMVPLDGSSLAEAALEPAAAVARLWDAKMSLVSVVSPAVFTTDPVLPLPAGYDEQVTALRREEAQHYLRGIVAQLHQRGLRASGMAIVGGGVAETILDLAHSAVGLVAIATHGRGGLQRLLLGSVADKLVRAAEVPVLVCRPSGPRARRGRARS